MFKRLDCEGGSDGVLRGGGSERSLEEDPMQELGRSCMMSRCRYSGDGHV